METSMAFRMAEVPVSRSTRMVRPCRASAREKLMAKVVLPTPPLPDEMGMIRLMATGPGECIARWLLSAVLALGTRGRSSGVKQAWSPSQNQELRTKNEEFRIRSGRGDEARGGAALSNVAARPFPRGGDSPVLESPDQHAAG